MEIDNKKILMLGLAVIVMIFVGIWVFSPTDVVVTGIGKVSVPATSATFNVTLTTTNDSASEALKQLRDKIAQVKKSLVEINIDPANITETQITLTPAAAVVANAKGFQSIVTLNVKTSNVAMVSEIVVNMYAGGATVVSQPIVSVEDEDMLESQALKEAMKQSKKALNETVGLLRPIRKIVNIQQASSGNATTVTKMQMIIRENLK
jgi:uncharacterized protein YggE